MTKFKRFIRHIFGMHNNVEINELNIRINTPDQLFNSLDPSPFIEKDLDNDAIEYIVSYFEEYTLHEKINILIHLPKQHKKKAYENVIRKAIENYFVYKQDIEIHKIKTQIRSSQISLTLGLMILIICMGLRYFVSIHLSNFGWASTIISEGLIIGGWVAMWKPMGDILYEWLPMKRDKEIYKKIAETPIKFVYD